MVRRSALVVVLALIACDALAARQPRFSSGTLGVHVDVLVMKGNTYVGGLTAADFELRDHGVLQKGDAIDPGDGASNSVLAFDMSGSTVGRKLADLISGSRTLLDGLK